MLLDTLSNDLKDAMRAKDAVRLRTIRSLRAALKDKQIELKGSSGDLSEEEAVAVVQKQAKQRRDAIEQYEAADREDLAEKEREELAVLKEYLPRQMSDQEIEAEIHQIVAGLGGVQSADFGRIMGEAMRRMRGRADGSRVQQVTKEVLARTTE